MQDTLSPTAGTGLDALVELVASAEANGDLVLSTSRMIDALLDARPDTTGDATAAVDAAIVACTHRQIVGIDEALELVATVNHTTV